MFVYVIVNSETLKIYIGQHKHKDLGKYLSRKFWDANHHTTGTRSRIYASMRKHPREVWSIHPLVSDLQTRCEVDELEQHYISALNTQNPEVGYNICDGGEGFTGPHTAEWRKESLERLQAYWAKPESRKRRSRQLRNRWAENSERRAKQSEAMMGNTFAAGRVQPKEEKQRRSQSMKGKQNRLGQKRPLEECAKVSASLKAFYQANPRGPLSEKHKASLKTAHQTCSCPHHVRARQQQQDLLNHK
jgi:hypothetical protein